MVHPGFVDTPLTASNHFRMPALITPATAAAALLRGWERGAFNIHFPRRFTWGMQLLRRQDYPEGRFTLAFVGYGPEEQGAVLELTHNWDTESYELGNAYGHIALAVPDAAAACAMETVTGKSWEEIVTGRILKPLEMKNTSFTYEEIQKAENLAYPYIEKNEKIE